MTPKGTPDDEHRDDLPEEGSPPQHLPGPPPPPQWLDEVDDQAGGQGDEDDQGEDDQGENKTQVIRRDGQQAEQSAEPSQPPGIADLTMSDFSRGTATGDPEPGTQDAAGPTSDDDEGQDRTRVERLPEGFGQQEAQLPPPPPPFPWAQQVPGAPPAAQTPPAPEPPQPPPAASPQPHAPQPPAPQPPAPQAQAAPPPFPWAQEIPETPRPPAPEPFPYAQEIPGQSPAPAPQPFPWAQEVPAPGASGNPVSGTPVAATPPPLAPPPQVDEPWRTATGPKRKRFKKKILFGVIGGVAAAALVAGGVVVLLGLREGTGENTEGARLAGNLFQADPAARSDGRDQELTGVATSGSTVVAVGGEADPGNYRGVFLVSTDGGRTFKAARVEGRNGGEPGAAEVPRVVGGGPGGWVAIGTRPGGGIVWTSEDGRTWSRLPDAAGDVFGPGNRVTKVIRTDKGFVAIGEHSRKRDFSDSVPAIWLSADGRNWDALTGKQTGLPLRGKVVVEEVAFHGGVVLMETEHTPESDKPLFHRAWRSTDGGRTWSPAKIPAPKGTRGLKVGGGEAGLVAVREVKSGDSFYGQIYTSTEATDWTEGGKLEPDGYRYVRRLLGTDAGYAAIVQRGRDLLIIRSQDGESWQEAGTLPSASGRTLLGASATGGQTVLVGRDPGNGDLNALLAVRDANGTEVPVDPLKIPGAFRNDQAVATVTAEGGQAVAVGSTGGDAAIWTSADGSAWNRARFSGGISRPALQRLLGVAHGGAGWLAVGDGGGLPRKPLVLTSADGRVWKPVDTDPVFEQKGANALATFDAAAGPSGYVVVGDDGLSGAIWFSPDLKTWQRGGGVGRNDLTADKDGNRWVRSAAGGSFGFVAVGGMRNPDKPTPGNPAVWTSPDGKKWRLQELELPSGMAHGWLTHVAAKGNVLVAAGEGASDSGKTALAYISTDGGKTWRGSNLPAPGSEGPVRVTAVTATPKGFAISGAVGSTGTSDVVTWTSANGTSWEGQAPDGDVLSGAGRQEITGLAPFNNTLLGVGRTVSRSGEQPVLWSRPLS